MLNTKKVRAHNEHIQPYGTRFETANVLCLLAPILTSALFEPDHTLPRLLQDVPELLDDFLSAVRNNTATCVDTRIRNCGKDHRCAQCHMGVVHESDGKAGVFPCWFHVHPEGFAFHKQDADGK